MRKEVIVQKNPKSQVSETFRTLRTNLQFINSKKPLKTLLITSTLPGEGKSWVAANLAVTFAKSGKKVLLVDADMRKGRQHIIFGLDNEFGLSNFLSGIDDEPNMNISKYIQRTEETDLYIIPKGKTPPNPSELLSSEVLTGMLADLEEMFDLIIFDSTPSLIVSDAIVLSRLVDSTLIVTEYNITKKENLAKVKRDIENVGGKIAGVVINRIPRQGKKYYGSTYYYGQEERETRVEATRIPHDFSADQRNEKNEISKDDEANILKQVDEYLNRKDK